jgi:hypothetical protein
MNSYLSNLVSRTLRPTDSVQPRVGPLFAPPTPGRDGPDVFPPAEEPEPQVATSPRDSGASIRTEPQRPLPMKASPPAGDADAASLAVPVVGMSQTNDKPAFVERPRRVDRSNLKPSPDAPTDMTGKEETANSTIPVVPPVQHVRTEKRVSIKDIRSLGQPEPPPVIAEPTQIDPSPRHARQPPARMRETDPTIPPRAVDATGSSDLGLSASRVENVGPVSAALRGAMQRYYARDQNIVQPGPLKSSQSFRNLPVVRGSSPNKPGDDVSPLAGLRSIFGRLKPADAPVKVAAAAMPSIEVTIGHIEVRATASTLHARPARPASPVVGLEEYLRRRAERSSE